LNLGYYPFSVYIKLNNGDQKNCLNLILNDNDFVNNIHEIYNEAPIMEIECPVCMSNIPETILACRKHTICFDCYTQLNKRSDPVACPICRSVGDGGQIKQMNRSTRKRTTRKRSTRKRSTRKNVKSARILTAK